MNNCRNSVKPHEYELYENLFVLKGFCGTLEFCDKKTNYVLA